MKQKPGIATRAVLLVVSLLWAIPLIWSVLTALKPSKESMLLFLNISRIPPRPAKHAEMT